MSRRGRIASDKLTIALLTIAAQGLRAHCSDPETHRYWLSDYPEERAIAMRACHGCPVFVECGDAARANREQHGVWAGKDLTRLTKREAAA
jgi:Transcription factor WhiB